MHTYKYEAMDNTGLEIKETIEANSEAEAQQLIREKGFFVTKINEYQRKQRTKAQVDVSKLKQVIVMRTDTNPAMRKGKMVAQGAHAAMAFIAQQLRGLPAWKKWLPLWMVLKLTDIEYRWLNGIYTKICCRVDSEAEFDQIHLNAIKAGLRVEMMTDSGATEFAGPTKTCLAIGPDAAEAIDAITGHLALL